MNAVTVPSKTAPYDSERYFEGQSVQKIGGDYTFQGTIVAIFYKRSGQVRCVVENREGILHIFNLNQLAPV